MSSVYVEPTRGDVPEQGWAIPLLCLDFNHRSIGLCARFGTIHRPQDIERAYETR